MTSSVQKDTVSSLPVSNSSVPSIGFNFCGRARGIKAVDRFNKHTSETWVQNYFFVEGKDFVTYKFRLGKDAMQTTLFNDLKSFINKIVIFPCSSSSRLWKGEIYIDYFYEGSELPTVIG